MNATGHPLRSARPDDAARIAAYHHQCWLEAYVPLLSADVIALAKPQIGLWNEWLRAGSGFTTLVGVDTDDAAIGHATVSGPSFVHLFVDPARQGEGLGGALLEAGERLIRQGGHGRAELHTRVGNSRAIALYRSHDWVLTEELVEDSLPDGSTYPEHVMYKNLDPGCS